MYPVVWKHWTSALPTPNRYCVSVCGWAAIRGRWCGLLDMVHWLLTGVGGLVSWGWILLSVHNYVLYLQIGSLYSCRMAFTSFYTDSIPHTTLPTHTHRHPPLTHVHYHPLHTHTPLTHAAADRLRAQLPRAMGRPHLEAYRNLRPHQGRGGDGGHLGNVLALEWHSVPHLSSDGGDIILEPQWEGTALHDQEAPWWVE